MPGVLFFYTDNDDPFTVMDLWAAFLWMRESVCWTGPPTWLHHYETEKEVVALSGRWRQKRISAFSALSGRTGKAGWRDAPDPRLSEIILPRL